MPRALKHTSYRTTADYFFIAIVTILVIFGLVMLTSASSDLAKEKIGDSYYYLKHQIVYGLLIGIIGFLVGFFVPYKLIAKAAVPLLILSIVFLALVFTPLGGGQKGGSERWLGFGQVSFQPGEFVKLAFIIFLSAWVSRKSERSENVYFGLLPFIFLLGIVSTLLVIQPSTTTAAILFLASLITYFTAGARVKFLFLTFFVFLACLSLLVFITPYRLQRIVGYLNPSADPLDTTYHINQALTAIGSGGIAGVGFGQSTTKLKYLPEPMGDSIFAVIAEEFGFIGSVAVVSLFFLFVWRGLMIGRRISDNFGRLLVTGFTSLVGLQAFINIGAISGIIPLTGVPLPFISYGGTALAVFLTMSGIIANISRYRR